MAITGVPGAGGGDAYEPIDLPGALVNAARPMVPRVARIIFPRDIDDDGRRQPVRIDLVETGEDDDEDGAQAGSTVAPSPPADFPAQRRRASTAADAGVGTGSRAAPEAGGAPPAEGGSAGHPRSAGGAWPGRRLGGRPAGPTPRPPT